MKSAAASPKVLGTRLKTWGGLRLDDSTAASPRRGRAGVPTSSTGPGRRPRRARVAQAEGSLAFVNLYADGQYKPEELDSSWPITKSRRIRAWGGSWLYEDVESGT